MMLWLCVNRTLCFCFLVWMDSIRELVDEVDEDSLAEIRRILSKQDDIVSVDRVRARRMGHYIVADAEVGVLPTLSVSSAQEVASRARQRVKAEMQFVSEVMVHVFPSYVDGEGAVSAQRERRSQAEIEVSRRMSDELVAVFQRAFPGLVFFLCSVFLIPLVSSLSHTHTHVLAFSWWSFVFLRAAGYSFHGAGQLSHGARADACAGALPAL